MVAQGEKSLGQAIDSIIAALEALDDSSRLVAVKAACEHLKIHMESTGIPASTPSTPQTPNVPPVPRPEIIKSKVLDIRSLKDNKNPSNVQEMACVTAYYLAEHAPEKEKKPEIGKKDIEKYFKQAGYPLPKALGQVLVDAKAAGYFDSAGHGKYSLNPVGHNLVAHSLPRSKGK